MGTLDKRNYEYCIKEVKEIEKKGQILFILSSQIFIGLNKDNFNRDFFNYFVNMKLKRYDKVITDGKNAKYFYVIKEGEFEISFSKSINELDVLIESFGGDVEKNNNFNNNLKKVKNVFNQRVKVINNLHRLN